MPARDATTRFSNRVADYTRYRPAYPLAAIQSIEQGCQVAGPLTVADIGAGTGIFTAQLLPRGHAVFAVEPNLAMRAEAEKSLGEEPRFHSVAGVAEATTLPASSIDVVTAAQAFHWFDQSAARREFARILRPGGRVALLWNERLTDATAFLRAYEQLLQDYATDYHEVNHTNIDEAALAAFFGPSGYETHNFANEQLFDEAGLRGRLLSSSYAPAADEPGHLPMLRTLSEIFGRYHEQGVVGFSYRTTLRIGRLSG